jgi:hypothetical protein
VKERSDTPQARAVIGGTILIVMGCCQLAYAVLALVAMFAISGFELVCSFCRAVFVMGPEGRTGDLAPSDAGTFAIETASTVVSFGTAMAAFSIVGGILFLCGKRQGHYLLIAMVFCALALFVTHLSVSMYVAATVYAIAGVVCAVWALRGIGADLCDWKDGPM